MTDSSFEEMAKQNLTIPFMYAYLRIVKTGFNKEAGFAVKMASNVAFTILSPWTVGILESEEKHLYAATSAAYPPKNGGKGGMHVGNHEVMKGS